MDRSPLPERIVFYDGLCGFCDVTVQWLLQHDTAHRLHFAPLQGETAQALRDRHPELPKDLDSLLFLEQSPEGEKLSWYSTAAFGIAAHLPWPYRGLAALRVLPRFLSDWGYRTFARYRYLVWGRKESCRIPNPSERRLFLA